MKRKPSTTQRIKELDLINQALRAEIVEHQQAVAGIFASEVRYRRLFEAARDGILILDAETGKIIDANPFMSDLLGFTRQDFLGMYLWEVGVFKDRADSRVSFQTLQDKEYIRYENLPLETKYGKRIDVEFVSNVYLSGGQKVIQCNIRDITERKLAAEKLREAEELFRLISENVTDLIAVVDLEGRRIYNSPSYKAIVSDPEALRGKFWFNEVRPDDRENIQKVFHETIRTGIGQRAEYHFQLEDESTRFIESQGNLIRNPQGAPVGVVIISRDITQRKSLEDQLHQSQKMDAIGQLACGVAHDFNNLLTIITGYGELVADALGTDHPELVHVKEIQRAADRAAGLTRQLLAFGRRQVVKPQVLDLNSVVSNVDKMLRRLIGEDVELKSILAKTLGRVKADRGQIEQVIMNLAVNARDAMPNGGKLTIETADVFLDDAYGRAHLAVTPGPYVMLGVSDTGCGMDASTQARVFEPFFTTKPPGKGTGLGLSTVYGIVKQNGGNILLYSEPDKGSTFRVYLPRVEDLVAQVNPSQTMDVERRGTETVLVAEDEETIRSLIRGILDSRGYTVLTANCGAEGLSASLQHTGPIHLLLTDVAMPQMSGPELAERLASLHPETKVHYMSGYSYNAISYHGVLNRNVAFIEKPSTPQALAKKVREVLDGALLAPADSAYVLEPAPRLGIPNSFDGN